MTNRFDAALLPATPHELVTEKPWLQRVQSSLYRRLASTYGNSRAGLVSWLLIRLAQPSHRDHRSCAESLASRHRERSSELAALVVAARGARGAPTIAGIPDAVAFLDRILRALSSLSEDVAAGEPFGPWRPDQLTDEERRTLGDAELVGLIGPEGWRAAL